MQSSKIIIALSLTTLISACSVDSEERVYGSWTEALTGETIEFRRDGTISWFGHEGTFGFKRSTNWASCFGAPGCPTGQVAVDVDSQSFRISYYSERFDRNPDKWSIHFRGFSAMPMEVTIGSKTTGGFTIYREGTITAPYNPAGFQRMDNGLPGFHLNAGQMQNYNDKIVAVVDQKLVRFNSQSATWEMLKDDLDIWNTNLDPEVIHNSEEYSLDGGYTWQSMPDLENVTGTTNIHGNSIALGTTIYATVQVDVGEEDFIWETWSTDLSNNTPTWTLVYQAESSDYQTRELIAIAPANTLVRSAWTPQGFQLEISADLGATFSELEHECSEWPIKAHSNGIYCRAADHSIRWFSLATNAWSTIGASAEDQLVESNRPHDALYIVRDRTLLEVSTDGSETTLAQFADGPGWFGPVYVLDEHIVFTHLTLWFKAR